MSTSSKRAAAAAAAKGKDVSGSGHGEDQAREARLAAAEAAAAEAAQAAAQAAEAAKAATAAAAALRQEIEDGKPAVDGSERFHTPERRRQLSPSPERRHRRRGRSPVVQVYRDIGGGWPMLTRANYHEWSLLMKVKLQARGLWEAVAYGGVVYEDDRRALEALCAAVPADLGAALANKPTAKLAWEAIATRRLGGERVRRATLQRLRGEWESLAFQPGEQIEDFALRLTNLMEQMAINGDTDLDEERAVEKFLRCAQEVRAACSLHRDAT